MSEGWRIEADDEWLAAHSSDFMRRVRRRARSFGIADAVSQAELGPFGGAPRNPKLKIGGKAYAVIRYTRHYVSYTTVELDLARCRRCGHKLMEVHKIRYVRADGQLLPVGAVRACRRCDAESWLFYSRMPSTARARRIARKVVL